MNKSTQPFETLPLDAHLVAELRSDHAGECGAVEIYVGILAVSRDAALRRFARTHLRTELRHRRFFDEWLPREHRSKLLPLWRAAGRVLGAAGALFGPRGAFRTVAAVESFVDHHYAQQIDRMKDDPRLDDLRHILEGFRNDEIEHRDDACARLEQRPGIIGRAWATIVGASSVVGVAVAKRI